MLPYLNFHSHTSTHEGENTLPSFGLHPWTLTEDWPSHLAPLEAAAVTDTTPTTVLPSSASDLSTSFAGVTPLIGECGLDRLCDTPYPLQLAAFEAQIRLSERLRRPLILHCVRAVDDVLRLHRGTTQPWIWHGFRGKPQQLQQLLKHGFYLSFGFLFNTDSLRTCPADRLFLETDEDPRPVANLYATVAALRDTTPETLSQQCWSNAQFIMHKALPIK